MHTIRKRRNCAQHQMYTTLCTYIYIPYKLSTLANLPREPLTLKPPPVAFEKALRVTNCRRCLTTSCGTQCIHQNLPQYLHDKPLQQDKVHSMPGDVEERHARSSNYAFPRMNAVERTLCKAYH
jgi:hypothetical protein